EEPGQFWKDFIRETAPQFRRPTIEQLEGLIAPIWTELIDGSKFVDPRLREIFDEVRPDAIVQDNVVAFPAVTTAVVTWGRLDSCVRATEPPFEVPERLRGRPGGLVYLSLGSLGSADVALMQRLVAALAETPHGYLVSKGPQQEQIELADNMWGAEYLPQPSILRLADLVITHAG